MAAKEKGGEGPLTQEERAESPKERAREEKDKAGEAVEQKQERSSGNKSLPHGHPGAKKQW